jgi:hypothetical protein
MIWVQGQSWLLLEQVAKSMPPSASDYYAQSNPNPAFTSWLIILFPHRKLAGDNQFAKQKKGERE